MILANAQREIPDLRLAVEQRGSCAARLVQTVPADPLLLYDGTDTTINNIAFGDGNRGQHIVTTRRQIGRATGCRPCR